MKIDYDANGTPHILAYERGDLVRLTCDERGSGAMGRMGDWGRVEDRSRAGLLTLQIAGYCKSRHSDIARLTGISPSMVEPCDRRGRPAPPRVIYMRPTRSGTRHAVPARRFPWSIWATVAAAFSFTLLLVVGMANPAM